MPSTSQARTAILDAAEALFARHGFTATTIKQIGADAEVNPALLYYYFDDKETLYHEVLTRRLDSMIAVAGAYLAPGISPVDAIRGFLTAYVEFMLQHPYLPRIIARELTEYEAERAIPVIRTIAAGVFRRLCDLIRQGQQSGRFRSEFTPEFAAISTVSQVIYYIVARPAVGILLGYEPAGPPPEVSREFARHAAAFALAALEVDPSPEPESP